MENQTCNSAAAHGPQAEGYRPADRLGGVSEYYFSRKLKEVAQMNAQGLDVISLGVGRPCAGPPSSPTGTATSPTRAYRSCAGPLPGGMGGGTASRSTPRPRYSPSSEARRASCT